MIRNFLFHNEVDNLRSSPALIALLHCAIAHDKHHVSATMPSIRRRSTATEVYNDTDDGDDTSYSERPNKRARRSSEGPTSDGEESHFSLDDSEIMPNVENAIGTQEQFQSLIDEPADAEEDERIEQKSRIAIDAERAGQTGNQERLNGVIESVECQHFMCHNHLTITLGPLINFIVGHNGSGKSAVLTAIQLCLGGKATSTNRGQNLKSFVKEGKENCVLKVRIKNKGQGGFRVDMYGDAIIVERHFSIHGTSAFKLKAANGKIVSTKRQELDEITDFYALQLDNPVNVLTQDQSRQFLSHSNASDKYKFFIKGVQLEQLNTDYNMVFERLQLAEKALPSVEGSMNQLKKIMEDVHKKLERTQASDKLRNQLDVKRRQYAWSQVEDQERVVATAQQRVQTCQAAIQQHEEDAEKRQEVYNRSLQTQEDARMAFEQAKAAVDPVKAAKDAARAEFDTADKEHQEYVLAERKLKGLLKSTGDNILKMQASMEQERARLEANSDGSGALMMQEMHAKEQQLADIKFKIQGLPPKKEKAESDKTVAHYKREDLSRTVKAKQTDLEGAQRQLDDLQKGDRDALAPYPQHVHRLLGMIDRERGWRQKPVGPLGTFVKLNQPAWSPILEKFFGTQLNNFAVVCKEDEITLSRLIKQSG